MFTPRLISRALLALAALALVACGGPPTELLKEASTALNDAALARKCAPEEFAAGHLRGAVNIDVNGPDFKAAVGELSKDGEYALYCRSGNRSATALATMKDLGFTHAYHLGGGIGAWTAAGGEVVTD